MTTDELADLCVMVTRPVQQACHLTQLIEQAGGKAFLFPVLEIHDIPDPVQLNNVIDQLDQFDLAIFISRNAVCKAVSAVSARRTWPENLKLATIGQGSARELKALLGRGPDICPSQQFNSEALLALDEMQNVAGLRIIIFRGESGREVLAETLRERGAEVTYAAAYRLATPKIADDKLPHEKMTPKIDIITITSAKGLHNLLDMVGAKARSWICSLPLVVVNQRLVKLAKELGFTAPPILVAHEASDEAIVTTITTWHSQRAMSPKEST